MEDDRFDHLTRAVTRRGTRRGAVGLLLGSSTAILGFSANAKKKKKGKKKKGTGCKGGCPAGAICSGKVCVFCAMGQMACGNTCVSRDDPANCGTCGNVCRSGAACRSGTCDFCPSGLTPCGNACVNLASDAANCGRCGKSCPSGTCRNGACKCDIGNPAHCPSGCQCLDSDYGDDYCSNGVFTPVSCSSSLECALGQVCQSGISRYCFGACLA